MILKITGAKYRKFRDTSRGIPLSWKFWKFRETCVPFVIEQVRSNTRWRPTFMFINAVCLDVLPNEAAPFSNHPVLQDYKGWKSQQQAYGRR